MNRSAIAAFSKSVVAVATAASVAACGSSVITRAPVARLVALSPADIICVLESPDGRYGRRVYRGSGQILSARVIESLQSRFTDVRLAPTVSEQEALESTTCKRAKYLILPRILHWEDRNTSWSGKPDKLSVRLELRDVGSGRTVNSVMFEAKSRSVVFIDKEAEALLDGSFDDAATALMFGD